MPRQPRETRPERRPAARRTVFGRPWPLPISPATTGLAVLFLVLAAGVWLYEGRYDTPPAEAARLLLPFNAEQIQSIHVALPERSATFARDPSGRLTLGGTPAVPTPTVAPDAPPPPVILPPGTKLEGAVGQLHQLRIDRVILGEPSASPEFGLDAPQLTIQVTPKRGTRVTLAIGRLNPDSTAYYVRREERRDTVLASRYTLDDVIRVVKEVMDETQP